jgi:hypothetical protein
VVASGQTDPWFRLHQGYLAQLAFGMADQLFAYLFINMVKHFSVEAQHPNWS